MRLFGDGAIKRRRERLLRSSSIIHPHLDEFGFHLHVVVNGFAGLFDSADQIGNINSGGIALWSRTGPSDAGAGGAKQRGVGEDLFSHLQRNFAPVCPSAVHVGTVLEVAYANRRADSVVSEPLEMIDQILTRVESLGHRPFHHVLESDVAMQINQRRHDSFAREVDV